MTTPAFSIDPGDVEPGDLVYYNNEFNGGSANQVYGLAWVVRQATEEELALLAPVYFADGTEDVMFFVFPCSGAGVLLTAPLAFGSDITPPIALSQLVGLVKAYADRAVIASWLPPVTALPVRT